MARKPDINQTTPAQHQPVEPFNKPLESEAGVEATPDDTPEYPLSAPMKPDDPERRSEQSIAETAGVVEEQAPSRPRPGDR
jgi:hypothetical protein